MKKNIICMLAGGCIFFAGLASCTASEEKTDMTEAGALFEKKCSICHTTKRATSLKKTREGWTTTVMRMKNSKGAPVSDEEAQVIIDYLAKEYGE